MDIPVLIPAYKPDQKLLGVVEGLRSQGFRHIVIVNDGSGAECEAVFGQLAKHTECHLLHHAVNLGKGRALKTGFNYCYLTFPDAPAVVTADADGQHLPEDIMKVSLAFKDNPEKLVLGARVFAEGTPLRSRFGNILTRNVFRLLVGKSLSDTQSGLRCIPRTMLPELIRLEGEKYEYEMNMLISTRTSHRDIAEVPITTVYIENNRSSHFNPLIDSMKIYFLLLRFSFSSLFASMIDFIIFAAVYSITESILSGIVIARVVAATTNFFINRKLVFHNRKKIIATIIRYYILVLILGSIAFTAIRALVGLGYNVIIAKAFTETVLFLISFAVQRDYIFVQADAD